MPTKDRSFTIRRFGYETSLVPEQSPVYTIRNDASRTIRRSRTGVANPLWRQQVERAVSATTSLSGIYDTQDYTPFYAGLWGLQKITTPYVRWAPYYSTMYGVLNKYPPYGVDDAVPVVPVTTSLTTANNQAIRILYNKIDKLRHQFQGGVFLGEFMKTVEQIVKPAKGLRNLIKAYKKTANKRFRGHPKKEWKNLLPDLYLEATFGWQPLMMDVKDAAVALARFQKDITPIRFQAYGKDEAVTNNHLESISNLDLVLKARWLEGNKSEVRYYGAFTDAAKSYVDSSSFERVIDLSGFDLRSFVPTIWELIPYSFFVDYFVNIGDLIQATCTDTSGVAWLAKDTVVERYRQVDISVDSPATLLVNQTPDRKIQALVQEPGGYRTSSRQVTRQPTTMPFPSIQVGLPDWWSKHTLNTAALLTSKL